MCIADSLRTSTTQKLEDQARRARVSVEHLPKIALEKMGLGLNHQGVIAVTGSYPYMDLEGLLKTALAREKPLIVVLDQVQDPGNLGAVMRSAYAFGAQGVVITKDRAAHVTTAVVRASAGASELLKTAKVTNLVRALDRMKDVGFRVLGASLGASKFLAEEDFCDPCVLVFGNEGRGLRRLTMEHCDSLFRIPMDGDFDSLNVSAAAAISLYEVSRQRRGNT
jgi:23S rRNA (guanosine2251-2'-O)-methyltransferase